MLDHRLQVRRRGFVVKQTKGPLQQRVFSIDCWLVRVRFQSSDQNSHNANAGVLWRHAGMATLRFDSDLDIEISFFSDSGANGEFVQVKRCMRNELLKS